MSPRLDRRTTENRDPHTVYLTAEKWAAPEPAYLEQIAVLHDLTLSDQARVQVENVTESRRAAVEPIKVR